MPDAQTQESLRVTVTTIIHHDESTGSVILRGTDAGGRSHTILGTYHERPDLQAILAHGEWTRHPRHGHQFRASYIEPAELHNPARIATYLDTLGIPGIGPNVARRITDAFGPTTLNVIDRDPEKLRMVPWVTDRTIDYLKREWEGIDAHRDLMLLLTAAGVRPREIPKIRGALGEGPEQRIREDPYVLGRIVPGFSFRKADALAKSLGIPDDSDVRKRAKIDTLLEDSLGQGDCGVPRVDLVERAARDLGRPAGEVGALIDDLCVAGEYVVEELQGTSVVYLPRVIAVERGIAEDIGRISTFRPSWSRLNADAEIDAQCAMSGFRLGRDQREAVRMILSEPVSVMTGGPGVGKTTTLKTAFDILGANGVSIALCAPTGMAAKRMHEATGREASTIHSLLGVDPQSGGYKHDSREPIEADLVVADEFSMTDINLCNSLLDAIGRGTGVLFVGDVDQLPSVGPGRVLHDLIASGTVPVTRLNEVFRQGRDSMIVQAAHAINRGEMPPEPEEDIPASMRDYLFLRTPDSRRTQEKIITMVCEKLASHPLLAGEDFDPIRDVLVVAPMKKRGDASVESLNLKLRNRLNPLPAEGSPRRFDLRDSEGGIRVSFGIGDKVMNTVNRTEEGVVNGDIGFVREIDHFSGTLFVDFERTTLELNEQEAGSLLLAYATTVHKCQGAESKVMIMPVVDDHAPMLQRNLVYTGLTRAKKLAIMVGQEPMLERAIANTDNHMRWSYTSQALREAFAAEDPEPAPVI